MIVCIGGARNLERNWSEPLLALTVIAKWGQVLWLVATKWGQLWPTSQRPTERVPAFSEGQGVAAQILSSRRGRPDGLMGGVLLQRMPPITALTCGN